MHLIPWLLSHMFNFKSSLWCLHKLPFHHTCFSCHYFADCQRLSSVYQDISLLRTKLSYQSRGLSTDCWKPHNPMVGKHLGELPIHYAKMLDLIYGMICLAFTGLFRTCFCYQTRFESKRIWKKIDFPTRKGIIKVQNNQALWNLYFYQDYTNFSCFYI